MKIDFKDYKVQKKDGYITIPKELYDQVSGSFEMALSLLDQHPAGEQEFYNEDNDKWYYLYKMWDVLEKFDEHNYQKVNY